MKLLFKQRFLSWFDSYDIYGETGAALFTVKGQFSWGHCFKIFDANGSCLGMVKEKIFTFLPKFEIYKNDRYVGVICREFSFLKPRYNIDFNGWSVEGNVFEWDYEVRSRSGIVAQVNKKLFNWTDTYEIDVARNEDALDALMLVVAIDAEKCSRN